MIPSQNVSCHCPSPILEGGVNNHPSRSSEQGGILDANIAGIVRTHDIAAMVIGLWLGVAYYLSSRLNLSRIRIVHIVHTIMKH
jgi:hypothetical protein